jgi:hypothetical protein
MLLQSSGARGRDRTADTVIFSHVLYQLSYPGIDTKRFSRV